MVWYSEMTRVLVSSSYWEVEFYCAPSCHLLVAAHNQERPTAAVTPIQVQSTAGLGPAPGSLPHHPMAASQPPPPMAGPAAHIAAVAMSRANAPLACAAAGSLASPGIAAASLETEPSGRTMTILSGLPTSPDSAVSACGSSATAKPDKDNKVRPTSCFSAYVVPHHSC